MVNFILMISINHRDSGGNLGGGGDHEFSEILTYKRAKNSPFECKGGGVLSEI
jgi:hypothetical protein